MFGRKNRLIKLQQKEIDELKRRLYIAMSENCRHNKHDYFIKREYQTSMHDQPGISVWTERVLECKHCGKITIDNDRLTNFKYIVS